MSARHCRRKHWHLWKTKVDDNGKPVVECPYCGPVADTSPRLH